MDVYLKEVQMENFKSFGKKLTVPLFPGFTAITGPNGSGKSNMVDAILFVLGPKSSKVMRAGRLTDLIFNGGKRHKNPEKYCKVSLVFDNHERKMPINSDEVVLTRMIKRAPLKDDPDNYYSYFYINNRAASQSEFIDLLTHARISGDGYNIVKQGDVTNLVEMSSIDRRKIIDDIAGISTFDADIKKAEEERMEAEKNLERINIILNEITNQIRQLKKDRDAAYRYKELKDKLYETKAQIAYKKKQEFEQQIAEINRQIQSYENEQKKLIDQREILKKQHAESVEKLSDLEKKISEAGGEEAREIKNKVDALHAEEIKIDEKINYANDQILEQKNEKKNHETMLDQITKELNELTNQQQELISTLQIVEEEHQNKGSVLTSLKDEIAQSDETSLQITRDLVKMREEFNEKQSMLHEYQLKHDRLTEKIHACDVQIAEMQETKATYEFELKDIQWQQDEVLKEKTQNTKQVKDIEKKLFEKKKQESELSEQLSDLEKAVLRLQREKAQLQAESDAAQTVYSKYNQAVTSVLSARDSGELRGIRGTIAELGNVEKKYEQALEIAAGPRLQSIIVDDDTAAAEAIAYLAKKKLGRATFLPLNKMILGKPRAQALLAVKDEKSHGFAFDLVRFRDEYKAAFWYVFGDTVIVDSLSDARRLMGGVRLVDMKGNLVEPSGAMIGGSPPNIQLSFGGVDRSKFEEVSRQLQQAIASQDSLSEQLALVKKEITELEDSLRTLKTNEFGDTQQKELELRKKEFAAKLNILHRDLETKVQEKQQCEVEKNEILLKISDIEKRLNELDQEKEEKGKHLLKSTKKERATQIRTLEKEVEALQERLLMLRSDHETLNKKIELVIERKNEVVQKIESIDKNVEALKTSIKEAKELKVKIQNELKALITVEEQMSGKIRDLAQKRDELYKKTVTIEHDLDTINTKIESYIDLISRSKYRLPTLEESVKEIDQEIALYQVTITDGTNLPNTEALKQTVREIESKMQELEPVNMRALEEYEHQEERKKKFDEDVTHLKDQRKNLIKLVDEITSKKKERFLEVFDQINKNFKEMYAQLSEGGEAELVLEDPENIFTSGLTIKARPHGKKVLRLSALSGGEKSIASLALIFAIQYYDPSPFYVLDEIDMFLDGVNAEIVSRMIKQRSDDSQFISVSLRKIALKEANHIYGVTMHDSGISEMIANIDPESVGPQGEILVTEMHTHGH
ncbi:MAG: chromosome segregation protein SMC [Candidatus Thermoplasmatota archaeon]